MNNEELEEIAEYSLGLLREENKTLMNEVSRLLNVKAVLMEEISLRGLTYADYLTEENRRLRKELDDLRHDCAYLDDRFMAGTFSE